MDKKEKRRNRNDKIISCYGYLNNRSIAHLLNCKISDVRYVFNKIGTKEQIKLKQKELLNPKNTEEMKNQSYKERSILIEKLGILIMAKKSKNAKHNTPLYKEIKNCRERISTATSKLKNKNDIEDYVKSYCVKHGLQFKSVMKILKDASKNDFDD